MANFQADFKKQYDHLISDENEAGHVWWTQLQCTNLKPRLTHIMDKIFEMRSLHMITCLVADEPTMYQ